MSLNLAGWAKRLTGKPSITVGSVGLEKEMRDAMATMEDTPVAKLDDLIAMLARGDFDLVAVGRALLSEPDWPAKVRAARWTRFAHSIPRCWPAWSGRSLRRRRPSA